MDKLINTLEEIENNELIQKSRRFLKDLKDKERLTKTVEQLAIYEFNERLEFILNLNEREFMKTLLQRIHLIIADIYGESALEHTELLKILKKIELNLYQNHYRTHYSSLKTKSEEISQEISNNNEPKDKTTPNFIKHCRYSDDHPLHSCNNQFTVIKDENNKNISYLFCNDCQKAYLPKSVLMFCDFCNINYYSTVCDYEAELEPATWERYHCNAKVNDIMRCVKCSDIYYIDKRTNHIICLNCKIETDPLTIEWNCMTCNKPFKSIAKIHNPLEFKMIKNAIKNAMLERKFAKPLKGMCCAELELNLNNEKLFFFHNKKCKGIVLKGEHNEIQVVICDKCNMINNFDKFIWNCPFCHKRFMNIDDRILQNNKEKKEIKEFDDNNIKIAGEQDNCEGASKEFQDEISGDNNSTLKLLNKGLISRNMSNNENEENSKSCSLGNASFLNSNTNKTADILFNNRGTRSIEADLSKHSVLQLNNNNKQRNFKFDPKMYKSTYKTIIKCDDNEFEIDDDDLGTNYIGLRKEKEKSFKKYEELSSKSRNDKTSSSPTNRRSNRSYTVNEINCNKMNLSAISSNKKEDKSKYEIKNFFKNKKETLNINEVEDDFYILESKKPHITYEKKNILDLSDSKSQSLNISQNILKFDETSKKSKKGIIKISTNTYKNNENQNENLKTPQFKDNQLTYSKKGKISFNELANEKKIIEINEYETQNEIDYIIEKSNYDNTNDKALTLTKVDDFITIDDKKHELDKQDNNGSYGDETKFERINYSNYLNNDTNLINYNDKSEKDSLKLDNTDKDQEEEENEINDDLNSKEEQSLNNENENIYETYNEKIEEEIQIKEFIEELDHKNNFYNQTTSEKIIEDNHEAKDLNEDNQNQITPENPHNNHNTDPIDVLEIKEIWSTKIPQINLESYKIISALGGGSSGKIYKINELTSNKDYCLKKIIINTDEEYKNYTNEFSLLYSIEHENIIQIHGSCETTLDFTTKALYVLMDLGLYDWNAQIENRLKTKNPFNEKELIAIMKQLASALAFLQEQNISHRDIKPQNIIIFEGNNYKLADFGEAKERSGGLKHNFDTLRGTELFMSPLIYEAYSMHNELIHNPYKSDCYSLGLCFAYAASLSKEILHQLRNNTNSLMRKRIINNFLRMRFTKKFIDLLLLMLEINEEDRVDFFELENILLDEF